MPNFVSSPRVLLGAAFTALTALAAPVLAAEEEVFETASGPMRLVTTDDYKVEIHIAGQVFAHPEASRAYVFEQSGDAFLIFLSSGGNACPGFFVWLDSKKDGVFETETFGTCSDLYELKVEGENRIVTISSMAPGEGDHEYLWDYEGRLIETILGLKPSDTPPGADPSGWLGRHPAELLDSADWAELLLNVLTPDELDALREAMTMSSGFEEQEGWIAAYGWDKLSDAIGAIAIQPAGELLVALGAVGQEGQLWGVTDHDYPEAIRQVMVAE